MHIHTANIIIVSAVMPTLASILVVMRVAARIAKRNNGPALLLSDYLVFGSLFFAWALSVTAICGAALDKIGISPLEQTKAEFTGFLKTMFALQFLYIASVGLFKLSVLAFYRVIFSTKKFRLVCDITSGVVVAWIISMLLATLLRSTPISYNWHPTKTGHHGNIVILFSFVGASDIALDIFILALPIPMIRKLHMTFARKLAVAGIFSLGGFCIISSTVRLAFVIKFVAQYHGLNSYYSNLVVENLIWMIVEPSASVIAACLPTLGPLFQGGRNPASLVRSLRSVLSLGSNSNNSNSDNHSSNSSSELRKGSRSTTVVNEKNNNSEYLSKNSMTTTASSITGLGLGLDGRSNHYSSDVSADRDAHHSHGHDLENGHRDGGITVEHQVDVVSFDEKNQF